MKIFSGYQSKSINTYLFKNVAVIKKLHKAIDSRPFMLIFIGILSF
jgi:hypothetical protein